MPQIRAARTTKPITNGSARCPPNAPAWCQALPASMPRQDMGRSPACNGCEIERKEPGGWHAKRTCGHRNEGTHRRQEACKKHGRVSALREELFAASDHLRIAVERPEPVRPVGMTAAERIGRAVAQRGTADGRREHACEAQVAGADQRAETHDHGGARHQRACKRHCFEQCREEQHRVSPLRVCGDDVDEVVDGLAPPL